MEAAFVDVGRGRNAVLYAGEVNWDAVGLEGKPRRIESALKSGDPVLVQVTKDRSAQGCAPDLADYVGWPLPGPDSQRLHDGYFPQAPG